MSPAAKADLRAGDIILTFDGKKIGGMNDLPRLVAATQIGKKVKLTYLRDGKESDTTVIIDRLKDGENGDVVNAASGFLGMKVQELNSDLARRLGSKETSGVVVVELDDNGFAAAAGILVNDIVKEINGRKINTLDDYSKAVTAHKQGDLIRLLVRRGNSLLYVAVKTES